MRSLRLALVLAFLLPPTAVPVAGGWRSGSQSTSFDLGDAPSELAGLRARGDATLEERVLRVIAPSAYLMRSYAGGDARAMTYVAFYTGFGDTAAHDPQVCYPAQGFDVGEIRDVEVPLADGSSIWSKVFLARQGGHEEVVLHWFQHRGRWPARPRIEPWVRMLEAFRGHKAYAFVRVSVEVDEAGASTAREHAVRVASELAPWARAVLERSATSRSAREEAAQPRAQEGRGRHG
jgi:EpsI family protein